MERDGRHKAPLVAAELLAADGWERVWSTLPKAVAPNRAIVLHVEGQKSRGMRVAQITLDLKKNK